MALGGIVEDVKNSENFQRGKALGILLGTQRSAEDVTVKRRSYRKLREET